MPCGRSTFSPSERSPIRVMRRDPEDNVTAKTDSVGCHDADVNEIVLLGRDCIVCGLVWSISSARSS